MKLIIAGSRDIDEALAGMIIEDALDCYVENIPHVHEVVSGKARGVDTLGESIASIMGIKVVEFPADWDKHGKAAGYIRNTEMAEYADGLLAIWNGESRGTKHMIEQALKKGLKLWVYTV